MILFRSRPLFRKRRVLISVIGFVAILLLGAFFTKDFILRNTLTTPIAIQPSGHFFSDEVQVSLRSPIKGEIRYTLDGSDPNPDSPKFEEVLQLSSSAVLKTAVFKGEDARTRVQEHDYLIEADHQIPVISITTQPENLWDPEIGIYVEGNHNNYRQTGDDWERTATLRWYEQGVMKFEHLIGLRLHGNAMRGMPQKSFRMYSRDEQGRNTKMLYSFFGEEGNRQHGSIVLRNGTDAQLSFMRDRLASELVLRSDSTVDVQNARAVVLYLNGEYWGMYYVQERFDETYFSEKYQVDEEALSLVEVPLSSGEDRGQVIPASRYAEDAVREYNRFLSDTRRCRTCMSFPIAEKKADLANLFDYLLFNMYFANFDWPYNNSKAWRYRTEIANPVESNLVPELDGRFRWLFFDVDVGLGAGKQTSEEMVRAAQGDPYDSLVDLAFPFRNLLTHNTIVQNQWLDRMDELIAGPLSDEEASATIDELAAELRPEMPRHIARWSHEPSEHASSSAQSMEEWEEQVKLLKVYMQTRNDVFPELTVKFFQRAPEMP